MYNVTLQPQNNQPPININIQDIDSFLESFNANQLQWNDNRSQALWINPQHITSIHFSYLDNSQHPDSPRNITE